MPCFGFMARAKPIPQPVRKEFTWNEILPKKSYTELQGGFNIIFLQRYYFFFLSSILKNWPGLPQQETNSASLALDAAT